MRILQVIPFFSPRHGGSATIAYQLSKQLVEKGFDVTIYTSDYKLGQEYVSSMPKVNIRIFRTYLGWAKFPITPGLIKSARKDIKDFDLIHMHEYRSFQNIIIRHYARKYNIPYILQPHATTPRVMQWTKLKWLFDVTFGDHIFRDVAKVIAVSKEEAYFDKRMGVDSSKVSIIYNAIEVESFKNLPEYGKFRRKYGIEGTMILYLGRVHRAKGIDILVRAFYELAKELPEVKLVVAGPDDGYRLELEKLVTVLGLNGAVKFTDYIDERDKLSAYVDADIFVNVAAYMGGVALTPLEATMCNTPVVISRECGEVIEQADCGYIVDYGDIKGLKEKLRKLIENPGEKTRMIDKFILHYLT